MEDFRTSTLSSIRPFHLFSPSGMSQIFPTSNQKILNYWKKAEGEIHPPFMNRNVDFQGGIKLDFFGGDPTVMGQWLSSTALHFPPWSLHTSGALEGTDS